MTKRKYVTQMALFSDCSESRFRQNFRKKFDWVRYNLAFCWEKLRHRIAIAIDTSYIPKSGKRPHRLLNTNDFKELLYYGVSDAA